MNLNDLANLGQIVGTIGVMVTLVYLAIQIRGNTRVASAQARHALSESRFFGQSTPIDLPSSRTEKN
jgi:hypothetical protein